MPPRPFQVFDASKIIHDVFRLAEINLETEADETMSVGQIKPRSCLSRLTNDDIGETERRDFSDADPAYD